MSCHRNVLHPTFLWQPCSAAHSLSVLCMLWLIATIGCSTMPRFTPHVTSHGHMGSTRRSPGPGLCSLTSFFFSCAAGSGNPIHGVLSIEGRHTECTLNQRKGCACAVGIIKQNQTDYKKIWGERAAFFLDLQL